MTDSINVTAKGQRGLQAAKGKKNKCKPQLVRRKKQEGDLEAPEA